VVFGSYEWDTDKAAENFQKHGVSFFEAAAALQDPHAAYVDASPAHEQRFAAIGLSPAARLLYVVHVERGERDRIISARIADSAEEQLYRQG